MYSNIIVYQKYLVTSIKVGCATRSLYASSGPEVEGVPTNNQRGWRSVQGSKRTEHKTYSPPDDRWVILTTSKAFHYFRARRDEIRFVFNPPKFVDKITVEDRMSDSL